MTGKFVYAVVLLCVCQSAFGDDLENLKQKYLKKIDEYGHAVRSAYRTACQIYEKRPWYLDPIKDQKMDLALSQREFNAFEVNKTAEGSRHKAETLFNPPKVLECIEATRKMFIARVDGVFQTVFAKPVDELYKKALNDRQEGINGWSSGYHRYSHAFFTQSDRTEGQIKSTKSKGYVEAAFNHLEKIANETLAHINSFPDVLAKNEVRFEQALERGPVRSYRNVGRSLLDNLIDTLNNCYEAA